MKPSLGSLESSARAAAQIRGHDLGHWIEDRDDIRHQQAEARCGRVGCDAWVLVQMNPPANGIDIGGTAVAVDCPDVV